MSIYLVTGRLGAGKTLASVGRIRDAILQGRRIATNLDLHLDKILPTHAGRKHPVSVMRLPDKPQVADLDAIGIGNAEMNEERNGLIVLDEMAAWLNARSWADKSRQLVIDWLVHSRKKGWDVMFIAQHQDQIDKQIRTALVEYLVVCRRLDRLRIPYLGWAIKLFSGGLLKGNMAKIHVGTVRYGTEANALVADRWWYRGAELYAGYDTRQVFKTIENSDDEHRNKRPPAGLFTYLPPWHTTGRHEVPRPALWPALFQLLMFPCAVLAYLLCCLSPGFARLYASGRA